MWTRAWIDACDHVRADGADPFLLIQNQGTGLRLIGTREWTDYRVEAELTPGLSESFGLVARAQGLRRYYAVVVSRTDAVRLLRRRDDDQTTLAEATLDWPFERTRTLSLEVSGATITAQCDGEPILAASDDAFAGGAAGLLCTEGILHAGPVTIAPASHIADLGSAPP